ncbi:MAG: cell division protein ZapA [Deltaproteobacteria bacterium]|jgi:Cell division protein ZapA.|nr:cell division protein ZapA [Deltaproteobacteria bacterium]MDA8298463.1 cell division protein ZapA [Deltaproteobacteria bacterium]
MSELIELKILNRKFILNSDKDRKYLESLAEYVNAKADEVVKKTRSVDSFNIAVLTALNIADDFMSNKMETNNESRRVLEKVNNIYKYISKS